VAEPAVLELTPGAPGTAHAAFSAHSIVQTGLRVAVVAAGAQAAIHLANAWLLDERVVNFSADADGHLLAWAGSVPIFAAACAVGIIALAWARQRVELGLLAAALTFLSLDETASVHERLGQAGVELLQLSDEDYGRLVWPIVFFPLLATVLIGLWRLAAATSSVASRRAILAGSLALGAAVAAEILWSGFPLGGGEIGSWPDNLEVAIEEGLELAGWIAIAAGTAAVAIGETVGIARRTARSRS
jgi:hypothetical protein